MNVKPSRLALLAVLFSLAAPVAGDGAEVYGKPLRGLTVVPLSAVAESPDKYRERSVRVSGTAAAPTASGVTISDGAASLLVRSDGFALPEKLQGAKVTVEGRLSREGMTFVASGAEVSR